MATNVACSGERSLIFVATYSTKLGDMPTLRSEAHQKGFVGVALCSVTIIRVLLRVLGKTSVVVLFCHSNETE